ncbi:MAG TPA: DUF554 domain-containing protein [Syntrophobacteraceae bacterium]|nr:DUF554 domain-containing protein [Syntrophobacteraceae bacterium]
MTGTVINVGALLVGSLAGVFLGSRLSEPMRRTVLQCLGLITLVVGIQMALETRNILIVMGAMLLGGIAGELLRIHDGLERLGSLLQSLLPPGKRGRVAEGFVTASLVFCVGPMAILGSFQDGISGDFRLLSVKSVLDGFASVAFSAGLGWGVPFAGLTVLLYQGGLTLFAGLFSAILTEPMIHEMTAAGGLIIVGIGIKLLELKEVRLASFLPALAVAPLIVFLIPKVQALF